MIDDLSKYHRRITTLFSSDKLNGVNVLTRDETVFFNTNGFLKEIKLLDEIQVEVLRDELDELMKPGQDDNPLFYEYHNNESADPGKRLFHALGAWRVSSAFHDLVFHPAIAGIAEKLLGGPARFWHDQLFVKPAHDGAVVAWHQDYSYWTRTKPAAHLTIWIGLDDSTLENGCVHYVPGSQKWDLLPRTDLANDMNAVLDVLTDEQRTEFTPLAIEMKKGEASIHHPTMVHGSYENTSNMPRRAYIINLLRDGVISDSDEPLLAGIPPIKQGEPVAGQFFPLLAS